MTDTNPPSAPGRADPGSTGPVLLSDPRIAAIPVRDSGEPLTELDESFGPSGALVRVSVARRLAMARSGLPKGLVLRVIEGYRTAAAQRPTEWWHWSYGDRYWALMTGATTALYGPVAR